MYYNHVFLMTSNFLTNMNIYHIIIGKLLTNTTSILAFKVGM